MTVAPIFLGVNREDPGLKLLNIIHLLEPLQLKELNKMDLLNGFPIAIFLAKNKNQF